MEDILRFYESELFQRLLGEERHPGGRTLVDRAAEMGHLGPGSRVLELGCGEGGDALYLAESHGCQVLGVDASENMIARAREEAARRGLGDLVEFLAEDVKEYAFPEGAFDAVMCISSMSLFQDGAIYGRIVRSLRTEGSLVVANIYLRNALPESLVNRMTHVSCVSGSESLDGLIKRFQMEGLCHIEVEDHTDELRKQWLEIAMRLIMKRDSLRPLIDDENAYAQLVESGRRLLDEGVIGYALVSGKRMGR